MNAARQLDAVTRRVLCLVLPDLLCELVMPRLKVRARGKAPPLAIVMTDQLRSLSPQDTLDAVNDAARRAGVTVGQSIAEAHAQLAQLQVRALSAAEVQVALGKIAESILQFGVTVALHAPDTVCLDVT
ncbi:MAG TPA: hypothetical protein VHO25_08550, partial [Polyangiaceae bacterium]|nr:hypothetical protein [Polyangiaceae bacterium]